MGWIEDLQAIALSLGVVIIVMCLLFCVACSGSPKTELQEEQVSTRFTLRYEINNWLDCVKVLTDTKTGKEYLVFKSGNGVAICKLD